MGRSEVNIMSTADTSIFSGKTYTPKQVGSIGNIPIYAFPEICTPTIEDMFKKNTGFLETGEIVIPDDINMLELAEKYYEEHKESLLKKYGGKYIAIINNEVIDSDSDFSQLANRVYKKYGYQTIYMPFVGTKERVVKIPSPKIKSS